MGSPPEFAIFPVVDESVYADFLSLSLFRLPVPRLVPFLGHGWEMVDGKAEAKRRRGDSRYGGVKVDPDDSMCPPAPTGGGPPPGRLSLRGMRRGEWGGRSATTDMERPEDASQRSGAAREYEELQTKEDALVYARAFFNKRSALAALELPNEILEASVLWCQDYPKRVAAFGQWDTATPSWQSVCFSREQIKTQILSREPKLIHDPFGTTSTNGTLALGPHVEDHIGVHLELRLREILQGLLEAATDRCTASCERQHHTDESYQNLHIGISDLHRWYQSSSIGVSNRRATIARINIKRALQKIESEKDEPN